MSCSCGNSSSGRCGCDPCSTPAAADAQNETLPSALDNFIYNFYGTVTKTVVDGAVVWTLPCDLSAGIPGYPRDPALGTACYFQNLFIAFDALITAEGVAITAARAVADAAQATADAATARLNTFGDIVTQNKAAVNLTGGLISGVAVRGLSAPTLPGDAATKAYADAIAGGISPQVAVRVASTANVSVSSAPAAIDGVSLAASDRVLLKNQTAPAQNGIYVFTAAASALTRATDADTAGELAVNRYYFVTSGTINAGTGWFISTAPTTLGTDPVVFSQFSAASTYTPGSGLQLVGTQFSIDTAIVMQRAQNLADLANAATARSNLGVSATGADANYLLKASNLSDLASASAARGNLGVSATGADSTYNFRANNLSDLASASAARGNLGVSATGADTTYAFRSNNLSDLGSVTTARANLGLLSMALQAASAVAITGGTILGLTNLTASSLSTQRTIKGNFNLQINVKDYGALGDGTTNDTTAINLAIAALTNYSTLYFPAGKYLVTPGSITGFASLSYVTVSGDGASSVLYSSATGATGNFLVFATSCSHITVQDLAIVGSATVRGSGIGIRMYASHSLVSRISVTGVSDFAIHVHNDTGSYNDGTEVSDCEIYATLGDGIHFGAASNFVAENNLIENTGDDSIAAVADVLATPPLVGLICGNQIYMAGFRGIAIIDGCIDVQVADNHIRQSVAAAIEVNRAASTTVYANRISVKGNKIYGSTSSAGPRGAIGLYYLNESNATDNEIFDTVNGSDICYLDFNDLTISGNICRGAPSRSIASDDSTTSHVAVNWYGLTIMNNIIAWCQANQAIYAVPAVGIVINNVGIQGNYGNQLPAGDWIYCARVSTGKITNNTSRDGKSVTTGGLTAFNNN